MSRTEEDIESGVDITIMRDATLSTYPASYSEVCDTFRPRLAGARRTDSGRERFIHFFVPSSVRIAGEVRSVLDLAVRERPRVEYSEGVPGKAKGFPLALEIPALQGHPAQRAPAPPPQERAVLLTARLGVLFTHGVDGARVQGEFLAASRRQPIQIKTGRPALVPFQRLLLSVVAEIPDEVAGASLAVEQSSQRFDAVSIDQQHRRMLMPFSVLEKTLKLAETSTFTPLMFNSKLSARAIGRAAYGRPVISTASGGEVPVSAHSAYASSSRPHSQERHFLPGVNAGVSVPKN